LPGRRISQQVREHAEGFRGNEFSADFVPGKFNGFEKEDASTRTRGGNGRRCPGRAAADDGEIEKWVGSWHLAVGN
jgi:hypothetical protein